MKKLALLLPLLALAACCRSVDRPSSLTEFPNEFHILPPVTRIGTVVAPVKDERIPVVRLLDKESEHILLVNPQRGGWFRSPSMEVWHDQWKNNKSERECRLMGRFDLEQGKVIHINDKLSRAETFDQAVFSFTINSSDEVVLYWNHAQIPSVSTNLVSGFRRFVFNSTPAQSGYFCLDEILDEPSPSPMNPSPATNAPATPAPHAETAEGAKEPAP